MQTTLVVMAAGIGSRFGEGIKQLEPVDDIGHIIMDYSVHDAIEAGFNHIIFVIRKDIEQIFKDSIGYRIKSICKSKGISFSYVFQDINDIPGNMPEGRRKPWGTGHAVLAAKDMINSPFLVINADDYYGKESFKLIHDYLVYENKPCMAGFILKNTLSNNGGVTRGICRTDMDGFLSDIKETKNIVKTGNGAEADGNRLDMNSLVSMNMWGFMPDFINILEKQFEIFFKEDVKKDPLKAEFLIPNVVEKLLEDRKISVKVLKTNDIWYGMTYKEDAKTVKKSFKEMIEDGLYKEELFSDLP